MAKEATTPISGESQPIDALEQMHGDKTLAAAGGIPSKSFNAATTVSSLGELKKVSPQFYNLLMMSIAQNMIVQLNRANDRVKEALKKMREGY